MHVVVLPSWYPDSHNSLRGSFFREQALAIQRAGHEVGVVYPFDCPLEDTDAGLRVFRGGATERLIEAYYQIPHLFVRAGVPAFSRYVDRYGLPDLIHVQSAVPAAALALRIKNMHGIPFVITEHASAYARGKVRPLQRAAATRGFREAAVRIAVSNRLGQDLVDALGTVVLPWRCIPNIVDPLFTHSALPKTNGGSTARFRLLSVATFRENKRHEDLVKAFAMAFKGDPAAELVLAGSGPLRRSIEVQAENLAPGQVCFVGSLQRDQVPSQMSAADAVVVSSRYESFGMVLIESAACGTPLVSTRCGGPESIVNGTNGYLVPPCDPNRLSAALRKMRETAGTFSRPAIRNDCLERFGEANVVPAIEAAYREALIHPS